MNDIQPGDLVVCVDVSVKYYADGKGSAFGLVLGRHYTVLGTGFHPIACVPVVDVGVNYPNFSDASRFRKLNDEPDNAELIAKIRACKPAKTKQPA